MVEDIQYTGIWWPPHKPEQQITGTFKFSQRDGVLLELMGSFREFFATAFSAISCMGCLRMVRPLHSTLVPN
jgi:ApeA-like protein